MARMDNRLEEQLVHEMGYSHSEAERIAERTYDSRSFIEELDRNRHADGPVPEDLRHEAERFHEDVQWDKRAEQRREEEEEQARQAYADEERARYERDMAEAEAASYEEAYR